jgi:hypothetical protein
MDGGEGFTLAAPATVSTQCHACPAMTAPNMRPAGSQASKGLGTALNKNFKLVHTAP